ncbi:MAG: anthranilate/aminodeoxychorismate synthase component II [Candidatus Jacksonbacteria bacterium RIFCSPLOWO2_02_FULL_43_9]|nr:MAG: anthranilate/aminodeoxychorismate synthase component II [Candidatus Jacksonbacteria bacterium RIFCSPHIGHO2_02_FULL_43_10]OGY70518.1 MAG: anthranilate/aminodeoxychorismate synthase component II [Candidatus Jacksonbacteria bacterium RIFCSPLOWO2_01_FULL_44_13]OGY74241.1 MAG: anthranilate/aminodeoxychorismate synthase component II [Candidatus Jacksonbacteria bacterium RIFCSPLOWO2_02_FULL_43_9]
MILIIDNFDSFTYNLVQYFGEMGGNVTVVRNNLFGVGELLLMGPSHVVVSPGPCTPKEAGVSIDAIRAFGDQGTPVLGVCLGHQAIGVVFGGTIVRATRLMHGKTSIIKHDGTGVFAGIPNKFTACRYHSLVIDRAEFPVGSLRVTAESTDDGEIMGVAHRTLPVYGVQFHPEAILTEHGKLLLRNFLNMRGCAQ